MKTTAHRWLARLAFSFFVVSAALGWQGYHAMLSQAPGWQIGLDWLGASCAIWLGFAGISERHRGND